MKKFLSTILGIVLFVVPLLGCTESSDKKSEETGIEFSFEQDGDISVKKDGEALVESKYFYTYYVAFKDTENSEETVRYLLEDSSLKEEFYSKLSGKTIKLEKTEAASIPNGLSMKMFLMPNTPMEFTVTKDGVLWYCCNKNNENIYYSSQKEKVSYADLHKVFKRLDYQYPYVMKESDYGSFVFGTEDETEDLFYRTDVAQISLSNNADSYPSWIDDEVWVADILDVLSQKEISFRVCQEGRGFLEYDLEIYLQNKTGETIIVLVFGLDGYIYFLDSTSGIAYISDFLYMEEQVSLWNFKKSWIESK